MSLRQRHYTRNELQLMSVREITDLVRHHQIHLPAGLGNSGRQGVQDYIVDQIMAKQGAMEQLGKGMLTLGYLFDKSNTELMNIAKALRLIPADENARIGNATLRKIILDYQKKDDDEDNICDEIRALPINDIIDLGYKHGVIEGADDWSAGADIRAADIQNLVERIYRAIILKQALLLEKKPRQSRWARIKERIKV